MLNQLAGQTQQATAQIEGEIPGEENLSPIQKIQRLHQFALQQQGLLNQEEEPDPMRVAVARIGIRQQFDDDYKQAKEVIKGLTEDAFADMQLAQRSGDWARAAKILQEQVRRSDELAQGQEKEKQKNLHTEGAGSASDSASAPPRSIDEGIARAKARFK